MVQLAKQSSGGWLAVEKLEWFLQCSFPEAARNPRVQSGQCHQEYQYNISVYTTILYENFKASNRGDRTLLKLFAFSDSVHRSQARCFAKVRLADQEDQASAQVHSGGGVGWSQCCPAARWPRRCQIKLPLQEGAAYCANRVQGLSVLSFGVKT